MLIASRTVFLLLLLGSGLEAERQSARVVVTLPDWVAAPVCRVLDADDRVISQHDGRSLALPCALPAGTLACDAANAEPIDLPVERLCRAPEVSLQRGDSIEIQLAYEGPLTVEWLEVGSGALETIATRSMAGPNPGIVLGSSSERLLRVRIAGLSPVTERALPLVRSGAWSLPILRQGGEFIAVVQRANVRPDRYRVRGTQSIDLEQSDDGLLLVTGLRPGRYDLTPVYGGGVAGRPLPFRVEDAESTVVSLPSERVGQAEVTLDTALCADTLDVRIDRLTSPAGTRSPSVPVVSFPHLGQCSHRVAGLPAGRYEAVISGGPSGLSATSEFRIEEQQTTPVLVEASILRLSGRVRLNGQPFSSPVSLAFERMAATGRQRRVTIPVEADGSYSVSFAEPGRYRARVAASSVVLLGQEKTIDLVEAHTVIDWDLEGGSLSVDIENWDRASPVEVQLRRTSPIEREAGNTWIKVGPGDEVPIRVEGLGYDTYIVDGQQVHPDGVTRTARPETVTLSASQDSAAVRLRFDTYESIITVRNELGAVIEGAHAAIGGNRPLPPMDPGIFRLTGEHLALGSMLVVGATGFVPTCRTMPTGPRLDVALDRGAPVIVEFLTDQALPDTPGRILWSGSECPVALRSFERRLLATEKGKTTYLFPHFPNGSILGFIATAFEAPADAQTVRVVDGRVQITLPVYRQLER